MLTIAPAPPVHILLHPSLVRKVTFTVSGDTVRVRWYANWCCRCERRLSREEGRKVWRRLLVEGYERF